jgi:hypothetical protein
MAASRLRRACARSRDGHRPAQPRLLAHAQDRGVAFARTVGIGRQALFVDPLELERHRALRGLPPLAEPAPRPARRATSSR